MSDLDMKKLEAEATTRKMQINGLQEILKEREKKIVFNNSKLDDIKADIHKEQQKYRNDIKMLMKHLQSKEKYMKARNQNIEKYNEGLDYIGTDIYGVGYNLAADEELHIKEISVTEEMPEMSSNLGAPEVLEIFRLLNYAKIILSRNQVDEAKKVYSTINELYERLQSRDQEGIYSHVLNIFKPRNESVYMVKQETDNDIDSMIRKFSESVDSNNKEMSGQLYNELQKRYYTMNEQEKEKYYDQIMSVYNKGTKEN
jgi:hypothetical protein